MSKSPRFKLPEGAQDWITFVVRLPDDYIQQVCVIFEGYDNLAQVRTPTAGEGLIHIYTQASSRETIMRILAELRQSIPLRIAEVEQGTSSLGGAWIDPP